MIDVILIVGWFVALAVTIVVAGVMTEADPRIVQAQAQTWAVGFVAWGSWMFGLTPLMTPGVVGAGAITLARLAIVAWRESTDGETTMTVAAVVCLGAGMVLAARA